MSVLQYRRLDGEEADRAYVLARMADPTLTMEAWRAAVQTPPSLGGVLGAMAGDCVRAILAYSISTSPRGERQFMVDGLAAFDLLRPERLVQELIETACDLARRDCAAIGLSARLDAPGREAVMRHIADGAVLHRVI